MQISCHAGQKAVEKKPLNRAKATFPQNIYKHDKNKLKALKEKMTVASFFTTLVASGKRLLELWGPSQAEPPGTASKTSVCEVPKRQSNY